MKNFIKYISILFLLTTTLYSAPGRGGVLTFTQPDGTTFEGILKGDSAFHWIESNGAIVMTNPKDGFFYNAEITKEGKLTLTGKKPMTKDKAYNQAFQRTPSNKLTSTHKVDSISVEVLQKLSKASKKGSHSR